MFRSAYGDSRQRPGCRSGRRAQGGSRRCSNCARAACPTTSPKWSPIATAVCSRNPVTSCECGDGTTMCKHAAAVLSGIGNRLDERPELLFLLRGVEETELIAAEAARSHDTVAASGLEPCATQGAAASKADSMPNSLRAVESKVSLSAPTSTDPAASSRPVKKTLTYRPPTPTDARRRPAPTDLTVEAAGFVPTGEMVSDLREQCGCSVAEFGELIQVTPTTVRRWGSHARRSQPARRSLGGRAGAVPGEPRGSGARFVVAAVGAGRRSSRNRRVCSRLAMRYRSHGSLLLLLLRTEHVEERDSASSGVNPTGPAGGAVWPRRAPRACCPEGRRCRWLGRADR